MTKIKTKCFNCGRELAGDIHYLFKVTNGLDSIFFCNRECFVKQKKKWESD